MIKKLRIQLICVNMVIVAIMLSLLIGMLVYFVKRSVERQQFATLHRIAGGSITAANVDEIVLGMKIAPGSVHHQLAEWFIVSFVQKGAAGQHHGAVISVVFLAGAVVHGEVHIVISGDIKGVVAPALKRNAIGVKSVMADWTL